MPDYGIQSQHTSAGVQLLNGLNEAARQQAVFQQTQQKQQADQDRQDQQDYFHAVQDGWVPAPEQRMGAQSASVLQSPTGGKPVAAAASPGLIVRDPNAPKPAADPNSPFSYDPSRMATIGKKQMYKPTDAESGKSFVPTGQLGDALRTAGWDGKTAITPEQSHGIIQALDEAQPKDEAYEYDASGKYRDAKTGLPVPGFIGKKTKKFYPIDLSGGAAPAAQTPVDPSRPTLTTPSTPGASANGPFNTAAQPEMAPAAASPGAAPGATRGGAFSFAPPEKADKPDVSQIIPGMVGPNGGLVMFDKGNQSTKEIPLPKGSKPVMTAAQTEADKDRHVTQARLAEDTATRLSAADQKKADDAAKAVATVKAKHDAFQSAEKDQWDLRERYANLADPTKNPDQTTVNLPSYNAKTGEITDGAQRTMNPGLRQSMLEQSKQAERKALDQQGYAKGVRKSMGWGEFAAAAGQPTQPSAAPAAQAPKTTRPAVHPAPPANVTKGLAPGRHTFGNGQTWQKGADGSMVYVSGGQ